MSLLIQMAGVDLGYGRQRVLNSVDLEVSDGDFLGIVGPNGAGKTTLLKAILGLLPPLSGELSRRAGDVRIGYVPQRDSVDTLFPLTVLDIVLMGRYVRLGALGRPGTRDRHLAEQALDHVGIRELEGRAYRSLSGGQKQRALIARALVGEPNLLILDEPTNGMDLVSEKAIMDLVRQLHDDDRLTVLMVSHLLNTVINYADRIAIVGNGRVIVDDMESMITNRRLTDLYGIPVMVANVDGRRIVLAGGNGGMSPQPTDA